jgi:hypothetical protein
MNRYPNAGQCPPTANLSPKRTLFAVQGGRKNSQNSPRPTTSSSAFLSLSFSRAVSCSLFLEPRTLPARPVSEVGPVDAASRRVFSSALRNYPSPPSGETPLLRLLVARRSAVPSPFTPRPSPFAPYPSPRKKEFRTTHYFRVVPTPNEFRRPNFNPQSYLPR